jgi:CheY-like chemotaxis protein
LAEFQDQRKGPPGETVVPERSVERSDVAFGRILVIDDNEDVRQMMAIALRTQGYGVEEAADAGEALRHLRAGGFDLVLSDYDLPDETGATMLREAAGSGLLGDATALIVTAHTQPDDADGFEIIRKPINLERLMAQVRRILATAGKAAPPAAAAPRAPAAPDGLPVVDLVLYVGAGSAASAKARRNMESTLRGYSGCPIRYVVRDVAEEPVRAEEDRIVFTPTLVKRGPGTRAWVLGDLADASVVVELLKICGLNPPA